MNSKAVLLVPVAIYAVDAAFTYERWVSSTDCSGDPDMKLEEGKCTELQMNDITVSYKVSTDSCGVGGEMKTESFLCSECSIDAFETEFSDPWTQDDIDNFGKCQEDEEEGGSFKNTCSASCQLRQATLLTSVMLLVTSWLPCS